MIHSMEYQNYSSKINMVHEALIFITILTTHYGYKFYLQESMFDL
jgi:hypothetical protein